MTNEEEQEFANRAALIPPARLLELMGYAPRLAWLAENENGTWWCYPLEDQREPSKGTKKPAIVFDF